MKWSSEEKKARRKGTEEHEKLDTENNRDLYSLQNFGWLMRQEEKKNEENIKWKIDLRKAFD